MAPAKRKTHDGRASADAGENRPSPHRPGNTNLGQHDRAGDSRNNGRRRSSRGGQGGGQGGQAGGNRGGPNRRNEDRSSSTQHSAASREIPTPAPGSPPARLQSAVQTPAAISSLVLKREVLPFDYVFLTDERVASWSSGGREEVVKAGIQARQDEDSLDLASIFQEFARAGLDDRFDSTECGMCVKEILGPEASSGDKSTIGCFDAHTYFLDIMSMVAEAEESSSIPILRIFIACTGISLSLMRQRLDAQLLQNLGLTRDTFIRVGIRQATHLLYRQQNYNLLREESEGYSKLATELYVSSGGSTFSVDQATQAQARDAFERVKGLIGTFDLDVGRVLDITLDVFASILIKQFKFFVMFLRASSWWPKNELHGSIAKFEGLPSWALPGSTDTDDNEEATRIYRTERDTAFWERARLVGLDAFFELGGRKVVDDQTKARILSALGNLNEKGDADRQWIEETGTFPPNGNKTAAQLLGFKLRYYASPARDEGDELPPNLMFLVALLIKIGFVALRDLYGHLYPLDDDMPALKEEKIKELAAKNKSNRGGGAANALTMAGALADDTVPSGSRTREAVTTKSDDASNAENKSEDKKKSKDPVDQKSLLLVNLLTIGAIPEALYILGRFPWIPELFPEVTPLINRILDYSIGHVYELTRPTAVTTATCSNKKFVSPDQSGIPKGQIRLAQPPVKAQLRWPYAEQYDEAASGTNYKFYWEGWADTIPLCQNVDDIFTLCGTLLNYSGVNIGRHPSLLSKLARIGAMSLSNDNSKQNLDRWQDLLKRLLVPALSLTKANTTVVNEVYNVLRYYPVTIRYIIYAEWFEGQISRLPPMKAAFEKTRVETVSTMKRISKTNVSSMAKRLAKAAYASPGIVFNVALGQIESYSNLTDVVVECAKYFTDLGYDVLVWSLMSSLGGKDRNRNNSEFALLPSRWLIALSKFSGKVFKRYSIMNLSPIIQYINHQLYRGNATDLVIMRELIASMAGVVPDTDFTDAQITAMTGGPALRRHTLINLQDMRYESTKTAKRLIRALTETKIAGQLLLSIAQHKQAAIYKISDDEAHIKMLATMVDEAQSMLFQYLDLLRSNLDVEEFDEHVPGIPELMTDFGLAPSLAFMIGRASLVHRLSQIATPAINGDRKSLSPPDASGKADVEGDVGMKGTDESVANGDAVGAIVKAEEDVQMVDGKIDLPSETPPSSLNGSSNSYDELIKPLVSCVQNVLPDRTLNAMTPEFYVTFWSLTLGDLNPPDLLYDAEIKKIRDQERMVMNDRSDMSRAGLAKRDETKKRLADTREDILAEMRKEVEAFTKGRTRLLKQKSQWLQTSVKVIPDKLSDELLEQCFYPRMLLSPTDADYTFRMLKFLHDNAVPGFRTLSVYARVFRVNRLRSIIFTCSVREAENLGRFLKSALLDLQRWHSDNSTYDEQAFGKRKNLHGFAKKLEADGTPASLVSYQEFKKVLYNWHTNIFTAISDCLNGTEWMQIRNAITVLKTVGEVFPVMETHGVPLISQLEALTAREKNNREDLALTGSAVLVQLKRRSKTWITRTQFDPSQTDAKEKNGNDIASTAQSRATTTKATLKPNAAEFQPKSRASSVGVSTPKPGEVEDGEVDDAKHLKNGTAAADTKAAASSVQTPPVPQRSEILIQREKVKAERAAAQANIPTRPDTLRPHTPGSMLDRAPPSLPNRPDAPIPAHNHGDRHRHPERRDDRNPRNIDSVRGERPGDRPREYPAASRRNGESIPRDFGRSTDRGVIPDRERSRPDPPPRWNPDTSRENAERNLNGSRSTDNIGRLSRDHAMAPPRSTAPLIDRGVVGNSDRLSQVNPERQDLIDPGRAALISSDTRSDSPRRHREDARDRPSPRNQSPRRHPSDRDHADSRRDDRSSRTAQADLNTPPRARNEDAGITPVGPRGDRSVERTSERNDRNAFPSTSPVNRPVDPDHGRLNAGIRQQPADPNFGRLNPTPVPDIPSGPRDRQIRGANRVSSGHGLRGDTRTSTDQQIPRPPTPDKQPPTGPSSNRHPRRSTSGQFDNVSHQGGTAPHVAPVGVSAPSVHPDRAKHLPHTPSQQQVPYQQSIQHQQHLPQPPPPTSAPMHPDRLRVLGNDGPNLPVTPVNQMNNNRPRPPMPILNTGGPPSGPKGSQLSPVNSNANGMAPPTGPASAQERAQRGGRRQLAGINNMLQQGGTHNGPINVRGRGRVSAGLQQESPVSVSPNQIPPPPPGPLPGRQGPRNISRDMVDPARADLITGGSEAPTEDREKDRSSRRSGHRSRRSSKSPGRDRESKRGVPEEDRSSRSEYRDRRSGGDRENDRERHQPRTTNLDLIPGGGGGGSGGSREGGREGHSHRESSRHNGRERDLAKEQHDGTWTGSERPPGGRNREPRSDDRRGGGGEGRDNRQSRGDDSRKRRSDEGTIDPRGHDKRPRRM